MSNTELSAENRSAMLSCDLVILVKSEEGLLNPIMNTLSREDDIFKRRLREAIETPTLNRDTG